MSDLYRCIWSYKCHVLNPKASLLSTIEGWFRTFPHPWASGRVSWGSRWTGFGRSASQCPARSALIVEFINCPYQPKKGGTTLKQNQQVTTYPGHPPLAFSWILQSSKAVLIQIFILNIAIFKTFARIEERTKDLVLRTFQGWPHFHPSKPQHVEPLNDDNNPQNFKKSSKAALYRL